MIEALIGSIWPYLAAAAATVAALGAAWLKGRRDAAMEADFKRMREQSAARGRADEAADRYRRDGGAGDSLRKGDF
jgi:hypothetical protein